MTKPHWTDQYKTKPIPEGQADDLPTERLVERVLGDNVPEVSPLRLAVAKRLVQHARCAVSSIDDDCRETIAHIVTQIASEGPEGLAHPRALDAALDAIFSAMPQPPARKETSPHLASLASRILGQGYEPTRDEINSLAGSVLSQDETRGSD